MKAFQSIIFGEKLKISVYWLSQGKSTAVEAWIAYQGGGSIRKYMSFKECNLFFCFIWPNVFLVGKEQKIPKFPGLSLSSNWFYLERIEGRGLDTNPRCVWEN